MEYIQIVPSDMHAWTWMLFAFSLQRTLVCVDCRLNCAAIWRPYSTMIKGEVWALQRTKKSVGLCLSVLAI